MAGNDVVRNPGFANSGVSAQQYIANVIQGEASPSNPSAQFAVASVIQNRTDDDSGGFGDNVLETAGQGGGTPYPQFSGYANAPVGGTAYNLAGQLLNQNLDQSGSTGNALYYNNSSTGAYANVGNNNFGGNIYSDQFGKAGSYTQPSADFQPPVYNGSTAPTVANPGRTNADALQDQAQDAGDYDRLQDQEQDAGDYASQPGVADGGASSGTYSIEPGDASQGVPNSGLDPAPTFTGQGFGSFSGVAGSSVGPGGSTNIPVFAGSESAGNGPDTSGVQAAQDQAQDAEQDAGDAPQQDNYDGTATYNATPTPDSGQSSATAAGDMTTPAAIDAQTRGAATDTTAQDKAISSAADSQNKTAQGDTKALTGVLSGLGSLFDASFKNLFIRGAIIVLGLVVIGFGLYSLTKDKSGPSIIPV